MRGDNDWSCDNVIFSRLEDVERGDGLHVRGKIRKKAKMTLEMLALVTR